MLLYYAIVFGEHRSATITVCPYTKCVDLPHRDIVPEAIEPVIGFLLGAMGKMVAGNSDDITLLRGHILWVLWYPFLPFIFRVACLQISRLSSAIRIHRH